MADLNTHGEQIGSVISMTGSAWAISGTTQRQLTEGAPVYEGEEIVTESDSNVEIKLADDTILGQGEDSAIRLDDYVYEDGDGSLDFNMIKGVLRVVSGEIVKSNPEGFNLTTPMATIGIRGTEVMVQIDQEREIIGVDKMGEGHHVVISNAFGEVIIDKAGMFSGIDFDGSLIVPDEMPENFISAVVQAAPLTILGDPPRNPGDSQEVIPPQFYETINNQTGEITPAEGMEVAESDEEEDEDEDFDLTEEEIEALLDIETAAGTEETGIPAEPLSDVVDTLYNEFSNEADSNQSDPDLIGGNAMGNDDNSVGGNSDEPSPDAPLEASPPDETPENKPVAEDVTTVQHVEDENEPISFNVISKDAEDTGEDTTTLVAAVLEEESEFNGEVNFEPTGEITYIPNPGEVGTVVIDYTVEDTEGETSSAHLSITLTPDSEPVITVTDATGAINEGVMTASGLISAEFGADGVGSSIEMTAEDATWNDESAILTANDDSWGIELTETGYEFTQYAALADASDADAGEELTIDVSVVATDSDGSVNTGSFTVTVTDDGPIATDAALAQGTEDTEVSYNVLTTGAATTGLYGGSLIAATLAEGSSFTGEVNFTEDGTITYTPTGGESGTVDIDYSIMDSDGDTASAQLSIELIPDSEPVVTATNSSGDEADTLATASGTISTNFGADAAGSIVLSAKDATWDDDSATLTADDYSWNIELTEGGYEFTQVTPFEHSDDDEYSIDVTVTATDGDGSFNTGSFTILITDDGPTATNAYFEQEMYNEAISYNVFTDGDATTGADGGFLMDAALAEDSDYSGEVEFNDDGTITYIPDEGETGIVVIDYSIQDNDGDTATAQLELELAEPEPNEKPINLLVNGDFNNIAANVGSTWIAANATSVEGWDAGTFYNSASETPNNYKQGGGNEKIEVWKAGYNGVLNPEGTNTGYFVEIDYAGATDFISQTVSTEVGMAYLMNFEATIRPDAIPGETLIVQVWSGGDIIAEETYTPPVYTVDNNEGWTQFSLEFTADSDETTILFTEPQYRDEGNAKNTYGVLLDNVTLTADSEYSGVGGDYAGGGDYFGHGENEYGERGFIFGTDNNDRIEGDHSNNVIFGGEGDDTIDSGKGMDLVLGNEGDDEIDGGKNMDFLDGGEGDDIIIGGKGNDMIIGGDGDDTLTGGHGSDTFVFTSPYDGTDYILDFKTAQDQIALYESAFDFNIGGIGENQFASVTSDTYSGGLYFTNEDGAASSGLVYASASGSDSGKLYYDPLTGDPILLTEIDEDNSNLVAADIDIVNT